MRLNKKVTAKQIKLNSLLLRFILKFNTISKSHTSCFLYIVLIIKARIRTLPDPKSF